MDQLERFNQVLQNRKQLLKQSKAELEHLKKDKHLYDGPTFKRFSNDIKRVIKHHKYIIEFMRIAPESDKQERLYIKEHYAKIIKNSIADDFPIVFHGTGNIGVVREIIQSGGLFTPKQRGESPRSYATKIDVTTKTDISTSINYADSCEPFMPYGAIFAFCPQKHEIQKVLHTQKHGLGMVVGGVDSVNFKTQPERLYGIITTTENIERVKTWCAQNQINPNKVFTHQQFANKIKQLSLNCTNSQEQNM